MEVLKQKVFEKVGVPEEMQWLTFGVKNLLEGRTLDEYGIGENCTITLNIRAGVYRVPVRMAGGEKFFVNARSSMLVKELKQEIQDLQGIPMNKQTLYSFTGVMLEEEKTMRDYKIIAESPLLLVK